MQLTIRSFLLAVVALIAPTIAKADFFIDQLNGVGQTFTFSGSTSALSQYDTTPGLPAPFLPEMAAAFDNFTLAGGLELRQIEWTGAYDGAAGLHASAFRISFYQDNAGAVGAQVGATIVAPIASVNETLSGGNHFRYSYSLNPGSLVFSSAGPYWMSITAALDYGDDGVASPTKNSWGWAFNNSSGDDNSYQTIQNGPESGGFLTYNTFNDPIDYSMRLTVVPEPSSMLLMGGAIGGIAVRQWRKRRKQAAS